ncbi:hypothetical protein K469DRAFT_611935, partial [Zopfia rhizophila CBS 207.26]
ALKAAKVLIYKKKKLKIYFIYLNNKKLLVKQRVYLFSSLSNFSKYFTHKYLAYIKKKQYIKYNLYKISLDNKIHL